jgi:cis-3-alkyl-4-acyloxetan-2-one decarboxylase
MGAGGTTSTACVDNSLPPELARLYPFEPHFHVLPDGVRMHYVDEGKGPVVLMLHGNPTWSWMYRDLIRALSKDFRCIAVDHVGCGLSDKPQEYSYTLSRHISNVRSLVDALGINSFSLVAHDWGGAIASGLAVGVPDRVGRLVLMNTSAFVGRIPFRIAVCKIPFFGAVAIRGFNAFAGAAVRMAVEKPLPKDVARGFLWPYRSWRNRVANLRFVQDIPLSFSHPSFAVLDNIDRSLGVLSERPMMLLWGMRDWCFTPRFLGGWIKRFPNAQVVRYENAGHYVLEDAGEAALSAIGGFLRQ